jgi:cell division protein FtsQ
VAAAVLHLAPVGTPDGAEPLLVRLDRLAGDIGLGLDQVEISGHRFASDSEILDAVDLQRVRSFVAFDPIATRQRIERLPWIDTAVVERVLPDRLIVKVRERRPFAAWEHGDRDVLIDATGRQLASFARGQAADLPRIAGWQAPEDAARLLALVDGYPEIAGRLQRAERIAGRRWRLVLADAPVIELPAEADGAALAMLFEARPHGRLFDVAAAVIDMTVLRRITVRPAARPKRT